MSGRGKATVVLSVLGVVVVLWMVPPPGGVDTVHLLASESGAVELAVGCTERLRPWVVFLDRRLPAVARAERGGERVAWRLAGAAGWEQAPVMPVSAWASVTGDAEQRQAVLRAVMLMGRAHLGTAWLWLPGESETWLSSLAWTSELTDGAGSWPGVVSETGIRDVYFGIEGRIRC